MRTQKTNYRALIWLACSLCLATGHLPAQSSVDTNNLPETNTSALTPPPSESPGDVVLPRRSTVPPPQETQTIWKAGQESTNAIVAKVLTEQNEMVLKYEEFLRGETKEHHELIMTSYKHATWLVGIVVGILGIFGFKTLHELKTNAVTAVQEQVRTRMNQAIDNSVADRNRWIEETHRASRLKVYKELKSAFGSLFESDESILKKKLPSGMTSNTLEGKTILWVDDDPVGIACQVAMLEALNARVVVKQTTDDAVKELSRDGFNLVISNMNRSPNATAGIDLAKTIRERSQVPILIFTKDVHIQNHGDQARGAGVNELESRTENLIGTIYKLAVRPAVITTT